MLTATSCLIAPDHAEPLRLNSRTATERMEGNGHWLYTRDLQELMQVIQRESTDLWPQELDAEHVESVSSHRNVNLSKALILAEALADSAKRIPDAIRAAAITEADREAFTAQSETLVNQAGRLKRAAQTRDREAVVIHLESVSQTCRTCHARFIDLSGPFPDPP